MHFPPIITLLLAASAAAAAASPLLVPPSSSRHELLLPKRAGDVTTITADTLIQDITAIHAGVLANTRATQAYSGGTVLTSLLQGAPVLATVAAIHAANRKGFADAELAAPIDEPGTARVFQHTAATVAVSIPASVRVLEGKRAAFAAAGMTGVVAASLRLLLSDHDTFSAALLAKAYAGNETLTAVGEGVVAAIHDAIQSGVDAFE
ncbi:cell wall galactomanno protein [Diplodia corticola]|uniref:Cell wall galactomanno protein n=1 Tax=Diplodia corticola TaxID=236234 RepID=A0A1J9QNL2_9PEZI|nr:cell wall galactomanno protein [Diplodia corticola]OJD30494.1 cell wall galactomanno protein [Diplodia corticola]